jgi:riboflavin transporter FmnP
MNFMGRKKMEKHLSAVAALHVGLSILGVILGIFVFVLLTGIGVIAQEKEALFILSTIGTGVGVFFLVISVPGIIGGIGLFKRKEWARILVVILAAINLLNIPFGTALGVYSIWVLVQKETVQLFRSGFKASDCVRGQGVDSV